VPILTILHLPLRYLKISNPKFRMNTTRIRKSRNPA
jgi:hypothetical protein